MNIIVLKTAQKYIDSQPLKQRIRLIQAISRLPEGDIMPLYGKEGLFRLRVGDHRATFSIDYKGNTVTVRTAGPRGDIYKG